MIDVIKTIKDLYLCAQKLTYKYIFDEECKKNKKIERKLFEQVKHFSMNEFRALTDLMILYYEDVIDFDLQFRRHRVTLRVLCAE